MRKIFFFVASGFIIVAFCQSFIFSFLASFLGYALFWKGMGFLERRRDRFFLAFLFFFLINGIWLSWMGSTHYVGKLFYIVYLFLLILVALQFAIISILIPKDIKRLNIYRIFFIASIFTLFEWSRLFIFSGFSWNPVGMLFAKAPFAMQMAAVFGVYGLSFFVIALNLFSLKVLSLRGRGWAFLGLFAILPYLFGILHEGFWKRFGSKGEYIDVCLVQPNITPCEKELIPGMKERFILPSFQWRKILSLLKEKEKREMDLLILPEAAVGFGAREAFYSYELFLDIWKEYFGMEGLFKIPPLEKPFAKKRNGEWKVSNGYFAKALSLYFDCDLVIGFDDRRNGRYFNSALFFSGNEVFSYDKQILLPIVEYFPFRWCQKVASRYGIGGSFTPGIGDPIFYGKSPFSISICYEETYGELMRKRKRNGAKLFVNITNDAWYPRSKLPNSHFLHGKMRSVENGVALLRACNNGVTAYVGPFGRVLGRLEGESSGVLDVRADISSYPTLYSFWGDGFILSFSAIFIGIFFLRRICERDV